MWRKPNGRADLAQTQEVSGGIVRQGKAQMPPAITAAAAAASVTATSVATMAPPPPPPAVVGRRRPRPQSSSTLGLGLSHQHPQSHSITAPAASPSPLTNSDDAHAATENGNGGVTWSGAAAAPERMFLRDAVITAEQNTGASDEQSTNAPAGGHRPEAPIMDNGLYVRLMGRVVRISTVDDDGFAFVLEDGTASVHVVVGQRRDVGPADHHYYQLPSAAKRPRLKAASALLVAAPTISELELGCLVDCVGYLSLVPEIDDAAVAAESAEQDQHDDADEDMDTSSNDKSNSDDDNDEKLGAEETEEQQGEEDPKATGAIETAQGAIEVASPPAAEEQTSCSSPTNDDEAEASAPTEGPQQQAAEHVDDDESELVAHQPQGPTYYAVLTAVTVAPMSHPDAESLRTLELLVAASSASSDQAINRSNNGGAIQGIHMAGGLISQIGAYQPRSQEQRHSSPGGYGSADQQPQTSTEHAYSICSNTTFRFIRSAAADGGISEEDLAIALGCISGCGSSGSSSSSSSSKKSRGSIVRRRSGSNNGRPTQLGDTTQVMAVRQVLQELQAGGEIYKTRRGTYLPL